MGGDTGLTPFESWLLIVALTALIAVLCALVSSPRSGVSSDLASSAVRTRRNGDTSEDRATYIYRPVEAKRRRLTAAQRRARRRSLQHATRLRGGAQ